MQKKEIQKGLTDLINVSHKFEIKFEDFWPEITQNQRKMTIILKQGEKTARLSFMLDNESHEYWIMLSYIP